METELEKLEKQRKALFNELDLLREFETESMIDYNEPIDCKADQELSLVPRVLANIAPYIVINAL